MLCDYQNKKMTKPKEVLPYYVTLGWCQFMTRSANPRWICLKQPYDHHRNLRASGALDPMTTGAVVHNIHILRPMKTLLWHLFTCNTRDLSYHQFTTTSGPGKIWQTTDMAKRCSSSLPMYAVGHVVNTTLQHSWASQFNKTCLLDKPTLFITEGTTLFLIIEHRFFRP
jgi:hypothetical protein